MRTPWFHIVDTGEKLQTALMRLDPESASGPKGNEHAGSEQVLSVVEGEVVAEIGERIFTMHAGDSVIVRRGEAHQFRNESSKPAMTFNIYAPPAYDGSASASGST